MSVTRLLVSGLLVASGLILGAFTLHGYLDPQWPRRQMQAAGKGGPALKPWSTKTLRAARPRPIAAEANAAVAGTGKQLADRKHAGKRRAEKAEAAKPQQATFLWPWNWLSD